MSYHLLPDPVFVIIFAYVADRLIGEVPTSIHPVAMVGQIIEYVDRNWAFPHLSGVILALVIPLVIAVVAAGITAGGYVLHQGIGIIFASVILFSSLSLQQLITTGASVIESSVTAIADARDAVPALVGRDPSRLSPAEIRSAAVESMGENLSDGLVAPLLGFVIGAQISIIVGIGIAVWVKTINTMDSMLGYPEKPHGWGSAKLDDVVMWIPARVSAVLLAACANDPFALKRGRKWALIPRSPNSGWPMGILAETTNSKLRKPGEYTLNTPRPLPSPNRAHTAIHLVKRAGILSFVLSVVIVWV